MAKLKYSFDDYINNPSGKGSAVNTSINLQQYETDLLGLESRNDKSSYTIYKQGKGNGIYFFIIHFKIPSSTKGFFHDIVVELVPDQLDNVSAKSVKKYTVRFFCNDESFVFTYAYTFNSHGLLISELERHLPIRSLMQKPTMRNPDNAMGYVKNIVFAYVIMQRDNLFSKDMLNRLSKNAGYTQIKSNIPSYEKKVQERKEITNKNKKDDAKGKAPSTKIVKSKNLLGDSISIPKIAKTVGKTKTTSKSSVIKKSKRI